MSVGPLPASVVDRLYPTSLSARKVQSDGSGAAYDIDAGRSKPAFYLHGGSAKEVYGQTVDCVGTSYRIAMPWGLRRHRVEEANERMNAYQGGVMFDVHMYSRH